jgi:hypothetical protein
MHQHEALMDFSGSGTIQNVLLALKMYERWRSWIVFTTGALVLVPIFILRPINILPAAMQEYAATKAVCNPADTT